MSTDAPLPAVVVLLVDDQALVGAAVRRELAGESDIRVHHCPNSTEAIETAERIQPTVILQDLFMPEVDGLTLVRQYRANPHTRTFRSSSCRARRAGGQEQAAAGANIMW